MRPEMQASMGREADEKVNVPGRLLDPRGDSAPHTCSHDTYHRCAAVSSSADLPITRRLLWFGTRIVPL